VNTSRKRRRRDADIRSAAAAARRSVTIGGGGVSKMSAAAARRRRRTALAQHGFCRGRSTCTNLLESINDWTLSIQYRHYVTVAYVDFSKAFDSVSHEKLLVRLASYGTCGNLLEWLRRFLNARTRQTRCSCHITDFTICNMLLFIAIFGE